MVTRSVSLIILSVALLNVHAEKTDPGLFTSQAIGISWNPLGLLVDSRLFYTSRLVKKEGLLWESTILRLGLQNEFTPADNLVSLRAECEPVAFFDVMVKCGLFSMYNGLGYGCYRMTTGNGPYDLKTQNRNKRDNAFGSWVSVSPTVKAKFGRVIILNTLSANRVAINGQGYFLELRSYLPHSTVDVDFVNNSLLLFENSASMLTGASLKNTWVIRADNVSQVLSGIVILKSAPSSPKKHFLVLNAGMYLKDPLFANNVYFACMAGRDFRIR